MVNQSSIKAVNSSLLEEGYRKPLYDSYCFGNIPSTVEKILTSQSKQITLPYDTLPNDLAKYKNIVVILVDAMGWNLIKKKINTHPVLKEINKNGIISKLTAIFPSTTANCVTCMNTGLTSLNSGVIGWSYFVPELDALVRPLPYIYIEPFQNKGKLKSDDFDFILNKGNFYERLHEYDIDSHLVILDKYAKSTYNQKISDIRNMFGFENLNDGLKYVRNSIQKSDKKNYFYVYFDDIDKNSHVYGPHSNEISKLTDETLDDIYENLIKNKSEDTLIMITADHGHAEFDMTKTIMLNKEIPELEDWVRTNKEGIKLVSDGSIRHYYLYLKKNFIDIAKTKISDLLGDRAMVLTQSEAVSKGIFGKSKPNRKFQEHHGDLIIITDPETTVFWKHPLLPLHNNKGTHGGMSPDEIEIPLLVV
ncbi:alkaline phosphatase family protein [Candidatus Dojkabacteria bacterium]|uniref:Alkaline phosphatase family protein n=1 Tax=Candidatus Dojkabacteria bacterium TaxID=2099670 RepID=A0A955I6E9_9BACT|nr:alkaline phosphatase family protein [Candidatus Dojkabacteria bacterium]